MPPLGRLHGYARRISIERSGERDRQLATIEVQILGPVTRAASEPETLRLLVTDPELIQRWRAAHSAPARLLITIDEDPLEPMESEVRELRRRIEHLENELIRARGQ